MELYSRGNGKFHIETGDPFCDPELPWEAWVAFAEQIVAADREARFHVEALPDGLPVNVGFLLPGFGFGGKALSGATATNTGWVSRRNTASRRRGS